MTWNQTTSSGGGGGGSISPVSDWKQSVRAATLANISLSGTQTIDTVALGVGDSVLVKNQTTAAQNGIYTVQSGAWIRRFDMDEDVEATAGLGVTVEEGSQKGKIFILTTANPIQLGVTSLTFSEISGGGGGGGGGVNSVTPGPGLSNTGTASDPVLVVVDHYQTDTPPVTSNGQTNFTLSATPADPNDVELTVNGQEQTKGVDFSVSGTSLTWNNVDFQLSTTDKLIIRYAT